MSSNSPVSNKIFFKKLFSRAKKNLGVFFSDKLFDSLVFRKHQFSVPVTVLVKFSQNNIFVVISDNQTGEIYLSKSSGSLHFRGKARQTPDACHSLLDLIFQCLMKNSLKFFSLELVGNHRLRRFFIR